LTAFFARETDRHPIRSPNIVIAATQLRAGSIILHNGKPHRVTKVLHVTPGNWRGMVQTRLVNVETGASTEHRFRSEDKVERATLEQHQLQLSYRAGDEYHFMNVESFEMVALSAEVLGEAAGYLTPEAMIEAQYFEGRVVGVEMPMFVELTVTDTTPTIKGATAAASPKPATLETGLEIKVPQYIGTGDRVKVDTRTGEFIERVA
jgi:elongation factor P